ncbi:hypothetical protein BO70DRAFT_393191 [Aspergillus heteromorphus CBS 117.55]|uniref:Uncharacterized protein n=1 Tax=Aspergillus heteromorphus CBS 117.55 TaxID=1448321 RepID=A0A317X0H5_9EURO|nr:uncharacterized protein BO70DRAFT_393191 [Aspergillus heteromorphus CBS 117.55]PWY90000.1 hypothetical protein BO70DRAFT_393191 [Aspergillus heteromorphus CBS 117.55]
MNLKSLLLTLTATATLVAADGFYCPFAQDNSGMIQKAYCCDTFSESSGSSPAKIGNGCKAMGNDYVESCPKGGSVKCCYSIDPKIICTAEASAGDG